MKVPAELLTVADSIWLNGHDYRVLHNREADDPEYRYLTMLNLRTDRREYATIHRNADVLISQRRPKERSTT